MSKAYRDEDAGRTSVKVKLTENVIASASCVTNSDGSKGKRLLFDTVQQGFGVAIHPSGRKAYIVQRRVHGKPERHTFWRVGEGRTLAEARKEAARLLGLQAAGVHLNEERRTERIKATREEAAAKSGTLRAAAELTWQTMRAKGRSERTIRDSQAALDLYLGDWTDRPLASLSRQEVRQRHAELPALIRAGRFVPKERKGRGRTHVSEDGRPTANAVFRVFRAIYNRALREDPDLPANPIANIDWFKVEAYKPELTLERLPEWRKAVEKVENPIKRDLLLFLLHTGLRRESASTMRWEHVDLKAQTLHVPTPKGGADRAFTLPLSAFAVEVLERRKAEHEKVVADKEHAKPFVWPSPSAASGHVEEVRGDGVPGTVHDTRRCFASAAAKIGVDWLSLKTLMNHQTPRGDITAHYIRVDPEKLASEMQRISGELARLCEAKRTGGNVVALSAGRRAKKTARGRRAEARA